MNIKKRTEGEIERMRRLPRDCMYGCGQEVLVVPAQWGSKRYPLQERAGGEFVIDEQYRAVYVGSGGDYGRHMCPIWLEAGLD
jgi:hypothetical protein